jgi:hypothetical protein
VVKLLPCDHELMDSSPGNSLLQKCREMLPKVVGPFPNRALVGATCTKLPFFLILWSSSGFMGSITFLEGKTYLGCQLSTLLYHLCAFVYDALHMFEYANLVGTPQD